MYLPAFFFFLIFSNLGYGEGGKTFQQPKAHVTKIDKCFQKLSGKCHFYEKALGRLCRRSHSPWWQ
jgi:hypothetical protein